MLEDEMMKLGGMNALISVSAQYIPGLFWELLGNLCKLFSWAQDRFPHRCFYVFKDLAIIIQMACYNGKGAEDTCLFSF